MLHGGRLLQQVHVGVEDAIVNNGISRVAGGKKDLQVRTPPPRFVSESATVHVRHDQIGVKKTDLGMCGERFQRLSGVWRLYDFVAQVAECLGG